MKEFDRFVKSLAQSIQAFSQLIEAVGENLEKNLEAEPVKAARPARRVAKPAKPATVARLAKAEKPARQAKAVKVAKPAKTEKPKKVAKTAKPAKRAPAVKAAEPEKPVVKLRKKPAASEGAGVVDTVLKMIEENPEGINLSTLKDKTGFNKIQIQNSVFRLKKQGKITTAEKGVYIPVVIPKPPVSEEPSPTREEAETVA